MSNTRVSGAYNTSIIQNYGDEENVKRDVATLIDILERQGDALLLDVIAESIGTLANRFKLDDIERRRILDTTISHLRNAIQERT